MSKKTITSREKHIVDSLKLDMSIAKEVSEIGRLTGTHKYDVWLAKEFKKQNILLSNRNDIILVYDWAKKEKPNIFELSFIEALEQSKQWHEKLPTEKSLSKQEEEQAEEDERIIFRCSDKKHFFMLLTPEELEREGKLMRNCVGGYKNKITNGQSLIISLRDDKNNPHVTMEVDIRTCNVIQMRGIGNSDPAKQYVKMITEFALYATGYDKDMDKDLVDLMNMQF